MTTQNRRAKALVAGCAVLALGLAAPAMAQRMDPAAERGPDAREFMGQPGVPFSGVKVDADNQAVLDAMTALGARPLHTLSPAEARRQPTAADAVKEVLRRQGRPVAPPPGVRTEDITYRAAAGNLPARVYRPDGARGPLPVIVYFHGGGWVVADINVYDAGARALARESGAMVISFEYRHAPENKFPAAHDDAVAAYRWTLANAARLGGDPRKIAVAGESAGGNLAANVAIAARDLRLQRPVHQLLIYPVADTDPNNRSYKENANAKPLDRAGLFWFLHHTLRGPQDAMDPRLTLAKRTDLRGLPQATIIAAQVDPLRAEGRDLAQALREQGVDVDRRQYDGVTHEFFGMDAVVAKAREAQQFAGRRLRMAFDIGDRR